MNEAAFRAQVLDLCRRNKLLVHACRDSRYCLGHRGLPDLIIASEHGILFAELKTEVGDTDADQDLWIWTLSRTARGMVHVWRPADLDDGTIESALRGLAA